VPENWEFLTFAMLSTLNKQSDYLILRHMHKCDRIIVDECFMTNNKYMRLLKTVDVPVSYLGDEGQLGPIYNNEQPLMTQSQICFMIVKSSENLLMLPAPDITRNHLTSLILSPDQAMARRLSRSCQRSSPTKCIHSICV